MGTGLGSWRLGDKTQAEAVMGLLFKDSDRAAAIVACTMVEDSLEAKLKSSLRSSSSFKTLFGEGRPLHFFGSRNQLAYLMRLYGKPFFRELETIGKVRNRFAHMYKDQDGKPVRHFKSSIIKQLCDQLVLFERLELADEKRRDDLGLRIGKLPSWAKGSTPVETLKDPRTRYIKTCGLCVAALNGQLDPKITEAIWADALS